MCRVSYFIQEKPSYLHFPYVLPSVTLKQLPADCTGGKERFRFLFLSVCLMWNSVWVWQEHTFIHTVWVGIRIRMWFIGRAFVHNAHTRTLTRHRTYIKGKKRTLRRGCKNTAYLYIYTYRVHQNVQFGLDGWESACGKKLLLYQVVLVFDDLQHASVCCQNTDYRDLWPHMWTRWCSPVSIQGRLVTVPPTVCFT